MFREFRITYMNRRPCGAFDISRQMGLLWLQMRQGSFAFDLLHLIFFSCFLVYFCSPFSSYFYFSVKKNKNVSFSSVYFFQGGRLKYSNYHCHFSCVFLRVVLEPPITCELREVFECRPSKQGRWGEAVIIISF